MIDFSSEKNFVIFLLKYYNPFHGLFSIVNVPSVNTSSKKYIILFHGERDTFIRNKMLYATLAL